MIKQQGLTPLHLGVISGNARAVKRLLIRGADRRVRDNQGLTPGELAQKEGFENIHHMIEKKSGIEEYCNLSQPFRPMNKGFKQIVTFFLLIFLVLSGFVLLVMPCIYSNNEFVELGGFIGLSLLSIVFQLCAWLVNAGRVSGLNNNEYTSKCQHKLRNNEQSNVSSTTYNNTSILQQPLLNKIVDSQEDELIILYKHCKIESVCIECQIMKPPRSKHCEICKVCVKVYDHHCPWINNCVGCNNLKYFLLFIIIFWLCQLVIMILSLIHIDDDLKNCTANYPLQFFGFYDSFDSNTFRIIKYVVSGIIIIVILPFFVMLSILCFVQLRNLFLNLTTFERFSSKHSKQPFRDSNLSSSKENSTPLLSNTFDSLHPNSEQAALSSPIKKKNTLTTPPRSCSFHHAFQMCCLNGNDETFNFNKQKFTLSTSLSYQQQI